MKKSRSKMQDARRTNKQNQQVEARRRSKQNSERRRQRSKEKGDSRKEKGESRRRNEETSKKQGLDTLVFFRLLGNWQRGLAVRESELVCNGIQVTHCEETCRTDERPIGCRARERRSR